MSVNVETSFYALADFVGISLKVDSGVVSGEGKLAIDLGIVKLSLNAYVKSGITNTDYTHTALLIAAGAELGVVVLCEMKTKQVRLGVFNRKAAPKLTGLFEGMDADDTAALEGVLDVAKPKYFKGRIGKEFNRVI